MADVVLDLRDVVVSDLQPRAGGSLEVDDELSGVSAREEGNAEQRIQEPSCTTKVAMMITMVATGRAQSFVDRAVVSQQQLVVFVIEAGDEPSKEILRLMSTFAMGRLDETRAKQRHQVIATRYDAANASTTPSANAMNR